MITAQVERLHDVWERELLPVLPGHWEELALDKDKVPLNPNYKDYLSREAQGQVLFVTLRELGTLVGYFIGFVTPGLHYQTCLTLHADIFYVVPEARGKHGGQILFLAVKQEAIRRGVDRWFMGEKLHSSVNTTQLFTWLGAEPVERIWSLWLGD